MTGIVSQLIALVSFGNEYLKTEGIPSDFYPANSTFQYCNSVQFVGFKKSRRALFKPIVKEVTFVEDPAQWFYLLKYEGCQRLELYFESSKDQSLAKDHMLAGLVGGGGTWLIEACYTNYSNYWAPKWEVTNRDASDSRIWGVKYGLVAKQIAKTNMQFAVDVIKKELEIVLVAIHDFASEQKLDYWAQIFKKSIDTLSDPEPIPNYNKDMIVAENYSLNSKQLLFGAANSWVFGAMGSWNDLGFKEENEKKLYADLSENLYKMIIHSIIAVLNPQT